MQVCDVLKYYLRQLPEPVVPIGFYRDIVKVCGKSSAVNDASIFCWYGTRALTWHAAARVWNRRKRGRKPNSEIQSNHSKISGSARTTFAVPFVVSVLRHSAVQ